MFGADVVWDTLHHLRAFGVRSLVFGNDVVRDMLRQGFVVVGWSTLAKAVLVSMLALTSIARLVS